MAHIAKNYWIDKTKDSSIGWIYNWVVAHIAKDYWIDTIKGSSIWWVYNMERSTHRKGLLDRYNKRFEYWMDM